MTTIRKVFKTEEEARDELATSQGQDDVCVYQVPGVDGVRKVYIIGFYKQAGEWQVFCEDGQFRPDEPPGTPPLCQVETSATHPTKT